MRALMPVGALALLASLSISDRAQQPLQRNPATETTTLQVESRLVVLDVVVTGKDGKPLAGLTAKDFTVLEDKQPQTIRSLEYTSVSSKSQASDFKTVFVVDLLNSTLAESAFGKTELEHYLAAQPENLLQPSMLVVVNDAGFQMIAPYTHDRKVLLAALHNLREGIPFDFNRHDNEARLTITFDAIRQIALASQGSSGRTELIWLGHGFPAISMTGLPPETAAGLQTLIQSITNLLLQARMVVYKVDPAAVGSTTITPDIDDLDSAFEDAAAPFADSISFDNVTQQTGGHSFFNRNDVDAEVGRAVDLGGSFYTLAYRPTGSSDAAANYRHIRVLVDHPGAKVATRLGYFNAVPKDAHSTAADPNAATVANPAATVDAAIINNLAYTALGIQVESLRRSTTDSSTLCTLNIDPKAIRWTIEPDGSRTIKLLVGVATYTAANKPLTYARTATTLRIDSTDTHPALQASLTLPVHIPVSAAKMRIVVLAENTGALGSAEANSIPGSALSPR